LKKQNLSIIIPTFNRSDQLVNLVKYIIKVFKQDNFKTIILDGSDYPNKEAGSLESNRIKYIYYGNKVSSLNRWEDGINKVEDDFVVIIADDDMPHPKGLRMCVDFLNNNKDFSVAHGNYKGFKIVNSEITYFPSYNPFSIEQDNPLARLYFFLNFYVPITYAVHRTKYLQIAFKEVIKNFDSGDSGWVELLLGCIPAVLGKIKFINYHYYKRNTGQSISRPRIHNYRILYEKNYSIKYEKIKNAILKYLPDIENKDDAPSIVDIAFASYHAKYYFNKDLIHRDFCKLVYKNNNEDNGQILKRSKIIFKKIVKVKKQITSLFCSGFFLLLLRKLI